MRQETYSHRTNQWFINVQVLPWVNTHSLSVSKLLRDGQPVSNTLLLGKREWLFIQWLWPSNPGLPLSMCPTEEKLHFVKPGWSQHSPGHPMLRLNLAVASVKVSQPLKSISKKMGMLLGSLFRWSWRSIIQTVQLTFLQSASGSPTLSGCLPVDEALPIMVKLWAKKLMDLGLDKKLSDLTLSERLSIFNLISKLNQHALESCSRTHMNWWSQWTMM